MNPEQMVSTLSTGYHILPFAVISLILNHLIVLFNVFNEATIPLLFYNLEKDLWSIIKSFLIFLNRIPEYPISRDINNIEYDENCLKQLQEI